MTAGAGRRPGFQPDPRRAFEIAQSLIAIPSFKGEEAALASWASRFLAGLGFEVEVQELRPGQSQVIGTLQGEQHRPTLMLNGHLDIDPLRSNWTNDPFVARLEDNLLIGAGARNMQGGLTAILLAAEALSRQPERANLVVALVAGELQGGVGTTYALDRGLTADLAIVPEPFGVDNLVTDTWGVIEFAIVLQGLSEHVSKLPLAKNPLDAAIELRAVLLELVAERFCSDGDAPDLLFNIGGMIAGRGDGYSLNAANYSPDRCALTIDVRHTSQYSSKEIVGFFEGAIAEFSATKEPQGVTARLQMGSSEHYRLNEKVFPPYTAALSPHLQGFLEASRRRELGASFSQAGTVYPHSYCGADTAHMGVAGIPSVLVGPIGPPPTPGIGDDAVYFDEVLQTARFLYRVACDLDWRDLGRNHD